MSSTPPARCYARTAAHSPPPLFQHGSVVIQLHDIGWLVSGIFAIIATVTSAWLIAKHLRWYTNKCEQRHIVRILFLVPIYAIISFASYLFWNRSTPLLLIRDSYESIVLTAFFYLLLVYLSHNPEQQRIIFAKHGLSREADQEGRARGEPVKKWIFPLQFMTWKPRDGLYFLQLMKYGILQYALVRPVTTLIAIVLDYLGLYCESSWSPRWGHIYVSTIISISVSVAMYCLIQLYVVISKLLTPYQPLLKLFAIKAVVFLTFWQGSFLSLLSTFHVIKDTEYMTSDDIDIGVGALLETFEMTLFAFLHIKGFSYLPYKRTPTPLSNTPPQPTSRLRSLFHAMDFRETFQELWAGCVYLFDKARGREPSADRGAKRAGYFENAFSRPRPPQRFRRAKEKPSSSRSPPLRSKNEKTPLYVQVEREVNVDGQRQWLGNVYGLELLHRERSEGLELEIERELVKRGYAPTRALPDRAREPERLNRSAQARKPEPQPSWWRNIYKRLSQSDPDTEEPPSSSETPPRSRRLSRSQRSPRSGQLEHNVPLLSNYPANLEDLPPRSILGTYQRQYKEDQRNHSPRGADVDGDVLMPLPRIASPSRSAHRQNPPVVTVDRESTISPSAVNHPFPTIDGNQGYLAPASSRASRYSRDDSLLGRLFPDTMTEGDSMSMTDFGTVGDGTQSILSMSTDAVGQARKTPRARLTTNTPQIMTRGTAIDSTGSRALLQPVPEQVQPCQELPDPLSAELLVPDLTSPPNQTRTQLHSDERKASIHRRPLPSPPVLTPPRDASHGAEKLPVTRTIRHHTSRDDLDILPPKHSGNSHDLRRSNARTRPRAVTSPPEAQHFSTIRSFGIPWVPDQTFSGHAPLDRVSPQHTAGSLSSGQISPSHSSSSMLLRPGISRKPVPPMRDIGHQAASDARGYNHPNASQLFPLTPESSLAPNRHWTRDPLPLSRANPLHVSSSPSQLNPPSPHSSSSLRASRPPYPNYAAKPFCTINRLRKHQEGRHAHSPVSSDDIPSFSSRSSQATSNASRSPTNGHTNGSNHTSRAWRTIDYPSSSWYIPASP